MSCSSFKWYLMRLKRQHESDVTSHFDHQQPSSVFPFDYLSPASKKARMTNVKKANRILKVQLARLQAFKTTRLDLCDEQSQDIVNTISSSDVGRAELEMIFSEADKCGKAAY